MPDLPFPPTVRLAVVCNTRLYKYQQHKDYLKMEGILAGLFPPGPAPILSKATSKDTVMKAYTCLSGNRLPYSF